ncbi:Holliday junction branch migration protein RuvA [Aquabacter cavernae]|uniref:Holliday junction branch migration protein RuvA n=1 Tax=Aquabacter cavernae TaxID=2496029 RepID=UPI000F8DEF74|nr:Holliday junction branch migration protein RuvA [Aquabacter cavernae]
MIGKLKGTVDSYGEDHLILDVHGVGYLVHCSGRTLQALAPVGEAAVLFIETFVREDQIRLFGFQSEAEREWFRLLQAVQGIGAKTALAILSTLSPAELAQAIALGDKAMVARAPGVGPRVATRIVTELKDKTPSLGLGDPLVAQLSGTTPAASGGAASDAVSALTNLGYGVPQATAAIAAALRGAGEDASAETLIRLGLRELAR